MKRKYLWLLLLGACATSIPKPAVTDTAYQIPGLQEQKQERELWCAVAATRMMLSSKQSPPSQCEIASRVHGEDCCNKPSVACTKEIDVQVGISKYGWPTEHTTNATFAKVVELLKQGKPVVIYHYQAAGTSGASGHAVVAYWSYGDGKYIAIYDPLTGSVKFWDASYVTGNLAWYKLVWLK